MRKTVKNTLLTLYHNDEQDEYETGGIVGKLALRLFDNGIRHSAGNRDVQYYFNEK